MKHFYAFIYICFFVFLSACSLFKDDTALQNEKQTLGKEIHKPNYLFEFVFSEKAINVPTFEKVAIIKLIIENSQLDFLQKQDFDNDFALIRRINNDLDVAKKVLQSFGYYSGYAKYKITEEHGIPYITVTLYPKEQYKISKIKVRYTHSTVLPEYFKNYEVKRESILKKYTPYVLPTFAKKLSVKNEYAVATDIMQAVDDLPRPLRENGYPKAKVASSAFSINSEKKELEGTVFVNQGIPATIGEVKLSGNTEVSSEYIKKLCPWRRGAVWDERYLLEYRNELQKTGLFDSIKIEFDNAVYKKRNLAYREEKKKQKNKDLIIEPVELPILLEVREGKKRSVGGTVFYSTDQGLGLDTTWEHRNFFGNGEILKLSLPLMDERLYLGADFRKPAFGYQKQSLLVRSKVGYEKTDALNQRFEELGIGLERQIHDKWTVESILYGDHITPKWWEGKDYYSFTFSNTVTYDNRDSKNNAKKGYIIKLKLAPLYGFGNYDFSSVVTEFDGSIYHSLSDKTVLALRGAFGSMVGADMSMPKGKRFFLGGGGSVRGFEHQEIGKQDLGGKPLGGISYTLFNAEIRQHITEALAIVPFVDGGMVYESVEPDFSKKFAIGAGLGVRYDTPVGPVRFDFAVPLTDSYEGQKKEITDFQIYISIGQAF